jgi:hypothetical protein
MAVADAQKGAKKKATKRQITMKTLRIILEAGCNRLFLWKEEVFVRKWSAPEPLGESALPRVGVLGP